ncbi:MAG: FeoB-associated Cys-rich membrane protein [Lachnospiraceae bacterium]|nr:FeoB-associated Cys-rich membrane protein [Lachnospiraceae bacterium]
MLVNNIANIITGLIVLAVVVLAVVSIVRRRKKGKLSCGCECEGCAERAICSEKRID